ncbi:hypothetical protein ACIP88_36070 [Streptomyces uncialis]|uniref:hypothetical protein n=1 Tax=Streptomyces uncialis TaxID=1048205 RepID=UPI0038130E78
MRPTAPPVPRPTRPTRPARVCGAVALTGLGAASVLVALRGSIRRRLAQAIGRGRSSRA